MIVVSTQGSVGVDVGVSDVSVIVIFLVPVVVVSTQGSVTVNVVASWQISVILVSVIFVSVIFVSVIVSVGHSVSVISLLRVVVHDVTVVNTNISDVSVTVVTPLVNVTVVPGKVTVVLILQGSEIVFVSVTVVSSIIVSVHVSVTGGNVIVFVYFRFGQLNELQCNTLFDGQVSCSKFIFIIVLL